MQIADQTSDLQNKIELKEVNICYCLIKALFKVYTKC